METKRALITGITGQDGSFLAELLLDKGYEIYGLVRRLSNPNIEHIGHIIDRINLIDGDLSDQTSLFNAVRRSQPDEIYNLAAQSFVATSWNQAEFTSNVTGIGALRVFEAARNVGESYGKNIKVYQASSSEQFGNSPAPQNEETRMIPRSPYGAAKVFAHNIARVYRESYDMFISCGILFNHECVTAETPVIVRKNGIINILPIEDIVPHRTEPKISKYTTDITAENNFEVWDRNGWTNVTCMTATWNGFDQSGRSYAKNKPVYRTVGRGALLQTTGSHIIYTSNKHKDITDAWIEDDDKKNNKKDKIVGKPAWQIDLQRKPGDCLELINLPDPTNNTILTEEEAWLIGALVSDGYIGDADSGYSTIVSNKDIKIIEEAERIWYKVTGEDCSRNMGESGFTGEEDINRVNLLGATSYRKYLRESIYTRNGYKKIPGRILNAPENIRLAFLRGYNAGDGTKALSRFEFQAATTNSACLGQGLYWLINNTLNQRCTLYDMIHKGETYYKILINASVDEKEKIGPIKPLEEIIRTGLVNYRGWVYDLATTSRTFHAGIGQGWIHNSERRGIEFVSRKITDGVARIKLGKQNQLKLGNLEARRDWGYANDYVEAMWVMLQQEKPNDFVIASGENHSVKDFVEIAFDYVNLNWEDYVEVDKNFLRPAEIFELRGDYSKAEKLLGWKPTTSFKKLVEIMVNNDLEKFKKKNKF